MRANDRQTSTGLLPHARTRGTHQEPSNRKSLIRPVYNDKSIGGGLVPLFVRPLRGSAMPWEVTIRRADGAPLGDQAAVRQQIAADLPAMQFYREPSGPEKIAAARAAGVEFPEFLRKHLEQHAATERAELEGDGFSILLYGFEAQPLTVIHADVRGQGNPLPVLTALCRPHGWLAIDNASGQPVELSGDEAASWEAFQSYRDRAIRSIQESGE